MTLWTSEGRDSEGPKSWEPEGLELPLNLPIIIPARKAPPPTDEDDAPESQGRVIVIDLA
jgi:hypothetical protein